MYVDWIREHDDKWQVTYYSQKIGTNNAATKFDSDHIVGNPQWTKPILCGNKLMDMCMYMFQPNNHVMHVM